MVGSVGIFMGAPIFWPELSHDPHSHAKEAGKSVCPRRKGKRFCVKAASLPHVV